MGPKHLLYPGIQAAGEEEEEEAAECRWLFLLPGSYLISVQVCGEKPCWDLGQRRRNQDQQGQSSLGSWSCVPGLGLPQALLHLPLLPGDLFASPWPV